MYILLFILSGAATFILQRRQEQSADGEKAGKFKFYVTVASIVFFFCTMHVFSDYTALSALAASLLSLVVWTFLLWIIVRLARR